MNIKQASEQSGVSAPNIRFYEKEGLLTPARRQGNDYRDYTAGDVRTLKLIRMRNDVFNILKRHAKLVATCQAQYDMCFRFGKLGFMRTFRHTFKHHF